MFASGFSQLHPLPRLVRSTAINRLGVSTPVATMGSGGVRSNDPGSNPRVAKMRERVTGDAIGGWEKCWEEGLTPWDFGQPTPVVSHLLKSGTLPKGRVLIPGCGSGYDVVAIASPERYVVGLDISESAIKKAKEWSSSMPNANYFTFLAADFFTWHPTESFDLVFDYMFFCAIDPCMRSAWAKKIREILKPDGELITLIYPIGDHAGGPPYNVSAAVYEEVLNPERFKALSIVDNELAIEPRKFLRLIAGSKIGVGFPTVDRQHSCYQTGEGEAWKVEKVLEAVFTVSADLPFRAYNL